MTDDGRKRARALADLLSGYKFALVLSSPLRRALETCEIAGFGEVAPARAMICASGTTARTRASRHPRSARREPDWNLWRDGCPGGESPAEVGARADRVLARLASADGDALAFAHGHILRVLTARWADMDVAEGARFKFGAGAIGVLGHERDTRAIERWNLTPDRGSGR